MTTSYTSLLGLALPVTGELSGTWGDTVNNGITSLVDSAVAGTTTLSADADVTLTTTTGASNTSRQAVILWTAAGSATRTITAPAQSKTYLVINASSSTQSIKLVGVGPTTGVTIVKGESALCVWNGSDFIKASNTAGAATFTSVTDTGLTSGRVTYAGASGLLQDSANLTFNGTTLTANTIGAFILSGNITQTGNPSINIGSGALTAGATSVATLTASGIATFNSDASTRESIAIKGRSSDNSGRINLQSNGGTTNSALYWSSTDGIVGLLDSTLAKGLTIATATGAATFSGALSATGDVTSNGILYAAYNFSGTYPTSSNSLALGWNFSNGSAEVDFFNNSTGATDGFRFYQKTAASTATLLMTMASNGAVIIPGTLSAGATSVTTLTASGDVGVGTASPNSAGVARAVTIAAIGGAGQGSILELNYNTSTRGAYLFSNSANTVLSSVQNLPLTIKVNDATVGTFSSTGLAVTGALSATGTISSTTDGLFTTTDGTVQGKFQSRAANSRLEIGSTNNYAVDIFVNNAAVSTFSSTGLAVTGALTTTGSAGIGGSPSTFSGYRVFEVVNSADRAISLTTGQTATAQVVAAASIVYVGARNNVPLALTVNDTEYARIDTSGNLLVGTTTAFTTGFTAGADGRIATTITNGALPNIQYWSQATSGDNKFTEFYTEGGGGSLRGSITYNRAGGLVAYNTTSDYRAKDLFGEFTGSGAIIDGLKVYDGLMKGASIRRPMFVAHEAQAIVPYAVTGTKDAVNDKGEPVFQSMDHQILIPLLVAEVQALRSRISLLEATTR